MELEEIDKPYLVFIRQQNSTWKIFSDEKEVGLITFANWYQSKFQIDINSQTIMVESGSVWDWKYDIMKDAEDIGDIKMSYSTDSTISTIDQNFKSDTFLVRPPNYADEVKYYVLLDLDETIYLFSEVKFNKTWGYAEEIITYRTDEDNYDKMLSEVSTYFFIASYLHINYVLSSI